MAVLPRYSPPRSPVQRIRRQVHERPFPGRVMTIALGILATDCLVIAADTEVTDGFLESGQSKIRVSSSTLIKAVLGQEGVSRRGASVAMAGAGTVAHIRALTDAVWSTSLEAAGLGSPAFIRAVGDPLIMFHRDHILPSSEMPPEYRPLGATLDRSDRAFRTSVRRVDLQGGMEGLG